ncbi:acetoin reductase family protein [Coprinopsis marcescibilis]|uniref:Acetoin reductase family protein n=1 Tax=Coprinopsis marcescibilis TaxID=230819 RepID=A0A5C3KSK5_COPMA|nr:acetoin reductase family protein [Coprinopsis marcescibilis]
MATSTAVPRVAAVTGAARGLGRAIALRLATDGFDVAVNDIESAKPELESLQQEIMSHGRRSVTHVGDVSVEENVKMLVDDAAQALGKLDVMVANAGICITKPLLETSVEEWDRIHAINSRGTFLCYKYGAQQMIKQGSGGRLIGASSVAGKQAWSSIPAYSSTKFTVRGLTQAAAGEFGKHHINVNAYAPGPIDTNMLSDIGNGLGGKDGFYKQLDKAAALGFYDGKPEDIAALVSYLASPDSKFVTGQTIICDGGSVFD